MNARQPYSFFSSRINFWLEVIFDAIFLVGLVSYTIIQFEFSFLEILVSFVLGTLTWTFLEYAFHNWFMHKSSFRAFRRGHAQHHVNPTGYDALPFFLPGLVFTGIVYLLQLVIPVHIAFLVTSVVVIGFIYYGLMHYAIHHVHIDNSFLNKMKAYHELHHQKPNKYFGVTTSFWDRVFRTI